MKIKNVLAFLLLAGISQFVIATRFSVINESSGKIMVRPYWTGSQEEFSPLTPRSLSANKYWDSGSHHLKYILWNDVKTGICWYANVEDLLGGLFGRFLQDVKIKIKDSGIYTIDLKGNGVDSKPRQANQRQC